MSTDSHILPWHNPHEVSVRVRAMVRVSVRGRVRVGVRIRVRVRVRVRVTVTPPTVSIVVWRMVCMVERQQVH